MATIGGENLMAAAEMARHLAWDACRNVRDLGGYPTADGHATRWRALLRSDDLCRLTPQGQQALAAYGVRTIIDLRMPSELAVNVHPYAATAAAVGPDAPVYRSLSMLDEDDAKAQDALKATETTGEFYCRILDLFPTRVGAVISAVADAPQGGVLVHCFAGKDRTGITIGLLLALAGVPYETIAADYALSDSYLQPLYAELLAKVEDPSERDKLAVQYQSLPESILATLSHLDGRYGGVEAYLRDSGVSAAQIGHIRGRLRE